MRKIGWEIGEVRKGGAVGEYRDRETLFSEEEDQGLIREKEKSS